MNRITYKLDCGCTMQGDERYDRWTSSDGRMSVYFNVEQKVRFCGRVHPRNMYVLVFQPELLAALRQAPVPPGAHVRLEMDGGNRVFEQNYNDDKPEDAYTVRYFLNPEPVPAS